MKRLAALILIAMLLLTACAAEEETVEQLFHGDTAINIPLNPEETQEETKEATEPEETAEEQTEATEETKADASTTKTSASKSSGSKSSSSSSSKKTSSSSSSKNNASSTTPTETQPPETEAPETEPPETESPEAAIYDISDYSAGGLEQSVVSLINSYREEAGLAPLSMNGRLCGIASVRAYEAYVSWSHTRPNGSGWLSVLGDYGFGYGAAAEELVHSSGYDAASVVSKWTNSESASADLLNSSYTTIGVGVYSIGGMVYVAAILVG